MPEKPLTTMNPATRTKRAKLALRAADIEILACASLQHEWTQVRVYNTAAATARTVLHEAGFERVDDLGAGPHVTELAVWA